MGFAPEPSHPVINVKMFFLQKSVADHFAKLEDVELFVLNWCFGKEQHTIKYLFTKKNSLLLSSFLHESSRL